MTYKTTISVTLPVNYREKLDRIAQERSIFEMRYVSLSELVRRALERTYGFEMAGQESDVAAAGHGPPV